MSTTRHRKASLLPFGTVSVSMFGRVHDEQGRRHAQEVLPALLGMLEAFEADEGVFFLAWELVSMQPDLTFAQQQTALMMVLASLIATGQGSTCLPLGLPLRGVLEAMVPEAVADRLGARAAQWYERILALLDTGALDVIVGHVGEYKPLLLHESVLYHQRMWWHEGELIEALEKRQRTQQPGVEPRDLEVGLAQVAHISGSITLTLEQKYAVLTALSLPLTLITGGPGTGKTSVVVSLLRLLVRQGVDPARLGLAAPTGRAAYRMAESIRGQLDQLEEPDAHDQKLAQDLGPPQTLHRLLGYSSRSGRYHHHAHNPLPLDVLIVDEASMIDIFLMNHVLRALPATTHLVLLGDAHQLPSVEAGAVLRDLVAPVSNTDTPWHSLAPVSPKQHGQVGLARETVRLTKSHRMSAKDPAGREILQVAGALRCQEIDLLIHVERPLLLPLSGVENWRGWGAEWLNLETHTDDPHRVRERLRPFVEAWFERHIATLGGGIGELAGKTWPGLQGERFEGEAVCKALGMVFEQLGRARILAITKGWPTGTKALNQMILEAMGRALGHVQQDPMGAGVLVMMTKNDYGREVFNGDQGILLNVEQVPGQPPVVMAVFERAGEFVAFDLEHLRAHLDVAFAMTVHKSQGSEFDHVAVILPNQTLPLLTREVLYTAMTRSKQGATIVGGVEVLTHGVLHSMPRHSRLGGRGSS